MYISCHGEKEQYASCTVSKSNGKKTTKIEEGFAVGW